MESQWLRQGNCKARKQPKGQQKPARKTKVMQADIVCIPPRNMAKPLAASMKKSKDAGAAKDGTNW